MQKSLSAAVALWAAGMMLAGSASAQTQQTPAAKPSTAPATSSSKAHAKKTTTGTDATKTPAPLTTRKDKFSYALGMNIGNSLGPRLKGQSVEFDPKLIAQG